MIEVQVYKEHFRKNFSLAYPVMLSQLGHVLVGVADSVMVGKVGIEPLAAASFANSIFFLLLTFGLGVSYAVTPLVAAADGKNDSSRIGVLLKHGFLVNNTLGFILLIMLLYLSFHLHLFNQPVEVHLLAGPYLRIVALSLIPFLLFQTFRQFVEGLSLTKQAMYITVGANLVNIVLNYALIFGKFGFPAMGLNGAGWATLISRGLMAIFMITFVVGHARFRTYLGSFSFADYSAPVIRTLLKIGLPAGMQFIFEVGAFAIAAIMIGWLGAGPLAAHQIAINLASISYMMATGISAAATIRVGNQLGRKDIKTMRQAGFTAFVMVILLMTTAAVVFIVGRDFFPSLYVSDLEVIQLASGLIIVAGLFQISDGVQVVGLGALRGMADVKIPTVFTLIAYWVLGLPVGYFLGFSMDMGATGIWYGLLLGLTVSAILVSGRFQLLSRRGMHKSVPMA